MLERLEDELDAHDLKEAINQNEGERIVRAGLKRDLGLRS